jgi:uncharacterized protein YkwD
MAGPGALATPTPQFLLHIVREGETLIAIAARYELSTETLLATNEIRDPSTVQAGDILLIPPSEGVRIPIVRHDISAGDNLLSIAAQYGSSVKDILAANPALKEGQALNPGQTLVVPIVFNQPKFAPRREDDEAPLYYTVKTGDIPLTIAAQFEVPVEILLAANDISDPTRLQIGQELLIPAADADSFAFPVILHELVAGDTLLTIASQYGSSVKDILAVNPELDPAVLEVGEIVAVPIIFRQPRPTPVPNPNRPAPAPEPFEVSGPQTDLQDQMLALINSERAGRGLPAYALDETLAEVALGHAQDMVTRDYLAHITPEGLTVRDRIEAGGVNDAFRVGENIQVNTRPHDQTVQTAFNWFMNSRVHRAGLLHDHYNQVGVGIVSGPPSWYTVVIVFAER